MPAPAQTSPDAQDPAATADPIALAAFVARRAGRVLAYLDAVTTPDRALRAAGEAFAAFRIARAAAPDAEAAATTLLRATRRAASAHAENPYRPQGRERPHRRTTACDAMPRLLVAWTETRLPDPDVARLVEHLQECPDCRALRDAFDRAELGHRSGEAVDLDGTEIGVITTAMALAVAPRHDAPAERTPAPVPADGPARTGTPARPAEDAVGEPVRRRTTIPEHPAIVPPQTPGSRPIPVSAPPAPSSPGPADPPRPTPRSADAATPTDAPAPAAGASPAAPAAPRPRPEAPVDPLGPEALGYTVPRAGLPRPGRRPAVARVRRRRRRRAPSSAVTAAARAPAPAGPTGDDPRIGPPRAGRDAPGPANERVVQPAAEAKAGNGSRARTEARGTGTAAAVPVAPAGDAPAKAGPMSLEKTVAPTHAGKPADAATSGAPPASAGAAPAGRGSSGTGERGAASAVAPATVTGSGVRTIGRRVLDAPLVQQLGVPAVLLLVVLVAALVAAGAFAGREEQSVPPVTRPTLSTVPSDPSAIPPLP